jgi:hypothetical protein
VEEDEIGTAVPRTAPRPPVRVGTQPNATCRCSGSCAEADTGTARRPPWNQLVEARAVQAALVAQQGPAMPTGSVRVEVHPLGKAAAPLRPRCVGL